VCACGLRSSPIIVLQLPKKGVDGDGLVICTLDGRIE
jgi:hypothetical protein